MKSVWVAMYHHKKRAKNSRFQHGVQVAVFNFAVTAEQLKYWDWEDIYEPDRDDEHIEVIGPLEINEEEG
jgi:hypothetical protein